MAELHPVYIINISIKDFGTVEFCLRASRQQQKKPIRIRFFLIFSSNNDGTCCSDFYKDLKFGTCLREYHLLAYVVMLFQ